ncbi:MAG: hypothetical protein KGQ49_02895 [Verrucomicrobia bacterium]|nr:hypothetical protein [Verrucomicrobiota bacterium]MBU6446329.1 hypothetical protein [Verrucomicrobiota bacterium]MDE3047881.1 hypothetical protein [Verrucomicrobiota bacterium]
MRQEHPFFSRAQIFFGKPLEENDDATFEQLWGFSLEDQKTNEVTGLIFLWSEDTPTDDPIYPE